LIDNKSIHIAFILDGNNRWSIKNKTTKIQAYKKGFDKIKEIIDYSLSSNISEITLFTLSSENYHRTSVELIYKIIYDNFSTLINKLIKKNNVDLYIFGRRENLPSKIIQIFNNVDKIKNKDCKLKVNLAFNYGFKNEIKDVLLKYSKNTDSININNEKDLRKLFSLKSSTDPDILVRTGGYKRLSNFIMYNLTYTELFFTKTLWPDFSIDELVSIIEEYDKIDRKYGL
tara:strand:+ start:2904 stop:3590 length:687 start_codon:yes stop_codon:yes gene_type:complete